MNKLVLTYYLFYFFDHNVIIIRNILCSLRIYLKILLYIRKTLLGTQYFQSKDQGE